MIACITHLSLLTTSPGLQWLCPYLSSSSFSKHFLRLAPCSVGHLLIQITFPFLPSLYIYFLTLQHKPQKFDSQVFLQTAALQGWHLSNDLKLVCAAHSKIVICVGHRNLQVQFSGQSHQRENTPSNHRINTYTFTLAASLNVKLSLITALSLIVAKQVNRK